MNMQYADANEPEVQLAIIMTGVRTYQLRAYQVSEGASSFGLGSGKTIVQRL